MTGVCLPASGCIDELGVDSNKLAVMVKQHRVMAVVLIHPDHVVGDTVVSNRVTQPHNVFDSAPNF